MGFLSRKPKDQALPKDYSLPISRKYNVLRGRTYVIEESLPDMSFDAFVNIITTKESGCPSVSGLVVSRQHPDLLREKYGFENTRVYWLATRAGQDVMAPTNLGILTNTMVKFIEENACGIILLDGVEYLVSNNDFNKVLRVIDQVSDHISQSKCRMIIPIDPRAFDPKEMALLERNTERIAPTTKAR